MFANDEPIKYVNAFLTTLFHIRALAPFEGMHITAVTYYSLLIN